MTNQENKCCSVNDLVQAYLIDYQGNLVFRSFNIALG